jgi:hypothetical protein
MAFLLNVLYSIDIGDYGLGCRVVSVFLQKREERTGAHCCISLSFTRLQDVAEQEPHACKNAS